MNVDLLTDQELTDLKNILKTFDKELKDWKEEIQLGGKTIEKVNAEQPKLYAKYVKVKLDLQVLYNFIEQQVKLARSKALKTYYDLASKSLGERTVEKIIEGDPTYHKIYLVYLEVEERYEHAKAICEQFQHRAYSINNIVKARVAAVEDQVIRDD